MFSLKFYYWYGNSVNKVGRVSLEILIFDQLIKNSPVQYRNYTIPPLVPVITRNNPLIKLQPCSVRFILILPSPLRPSLSTPFHLFFIYSITLIMSEAYYNLWSPNKAVLSSPLLQYPSAILQSILFPKILTTYSSLRVSGQVFHSQNNMFSLYSSYVHHYSVQLNGA